MTDISVTAANVRPDTTKNLIRGTSGEAITAGQLCYKDATLGTWFKWDDDAASAATQTELAIAMCSAPGAAQPIVLQNDPDSMVNLGATLVAGTTYVGSDTGGGIRPFADLSTGDIVAIVGIATTTALLKVNLKNTGVGSV
jgi:hypothetical protein